MFDTWAWWEILHATPTGEALSKKYLESPDVRVITVDLALVELSAKLAREGRSAEIGTAVDAVEAASELTSIVPAAAKASGPLLIGLRRVDKNASLADAVMLAAARDLSATLISGDPCFAGQKDVRSS